MRVREIEKYLRKEMPSDEILAFEQEMESSPSLLFDVRLMANIIQSTIKVGLEGSPTMADLFRSAKRDYEESIRRENEYYREHPNVAASIPFPGDRDRFLCRYEFGKIQELSADIDKKDLRRIDDIASDEQLLAFVQTMMTHEGGTTILKIVLECMKHFGLKYAGMRVSDWEKVIQSFVISATQCHDIKPYEYFVCAVDEEFEDLGE